MNALVVGPTFYINEIKDYFQANDLKTFCAENMVNAVDILSSHKMDFVFINVNSINEAILLKYINKNHKDVKVVLITNPKHKELISVLKEGFYYTLEDPFRFQEIQKLINEKKNANEEKVKEEK